MLGEFLEISVHSANVLESLQFYEKLGFTQVPTGDTWQHAYGVVTDGRCVIGIHAYEFPAPSLTFVAPELRKRVEPLEAAGAEFKFLKLADDDFHELGFFLPDEQMVTLLEARTFTPPDRASIPASQAGFFAEYRVPVEDRDAALAQWLRFGLLEGEPLDRVHDSVTACCTGLNVGLTESRRVRQPTLVFHTSELERRVETLAQRGIDAERPQRGTDSGLRSFSLRAPEGTVLLVLDETALT